MGDPFESRWFKIGALVFSGGIIAYSAMMFVTVKNLRNFQAANPKCQSTDSTELTWEYWISLIILIIAIVFFLWAVWKILVARPAREKVYKKTGEFFTTEEGGFGSDGTETTVKTKTAKAKTRAVKTSLYEE